MSSGKILLGVLGGVAAGALLGVLFAPDKGTGTRKKISKKADRYADDLKERFNDFVEEMKEKFEPAEEEAETTGKPKKQLHRAAKDTKHAMG
jgi:gas vesicle protein